MTTTPAFLPGSLARYIDDNTTAPSALEHELIERTRHVVGAGMQIGMTQARTMALLTRVLQPQTVVEIGTFTGLSALVMAQELDQHGRLITCDIDAAMADIGREFWDRAGVGERIDCRIGPALETLADLQGELDAVDLAFIDADKKQYAAYLEALHPLLHPRSIVLVDNVLWDGRVADEAIDDPTTEAIRNFNAWVLADPRFDVALSPIGDGLSIVTLSR